MAKTVNSAFNEFFKNTINISSTDNETALKSRKWLFDQIENICENDLFLKSVKGYNSNFGSFARKTKIKPLDDIDIIIGLNGGELQAVGTQWDNLSLKLKSDAKDLNLINLSETRNYSSDKYLNSNKVKNKLVTALKGISQYENAAIHARGQAVTLKLKSYTWTYDIVPAFYSGEVEYGEPYYVIPNGSGNWLKTNPKIEQEKVSRLNQEFDGIVLKTIRLVKYWNKRGKMPSIASYVLETIVLDYFEQTTYKKETNWVDVHFSGVLLYISNNIMKAVNDSKNIQGNINNLIWDQKYKIQQRAKNDREKVSNALNAELKEKDMEKSINVWRDILGKNFPKYG